MCWKVASLRLSYLLQGIFAKGVRWYLLCFSERSELPALCQHKVRGQKNSRRGLEGSSVLDPRRAGGHRDVGMLKNVFGRGVWETREDEGASWGAGRGRRARTACPGVQPQVRLCLMRAQTASRKDSPGRAKCFILIPLHVRAEHVP